MGETSFPHNPLLLNCINVYNRKKDKRIRGKGIRETREGGYGGN